MMGVKGDDSPRSAFRYHKVNITRPFWLSKYKVTHGMWNAYQKVALTKEDHAFGGMKRVHCTSPKEMDAFCEWLTKRFRSNLPKGCVVRLPTEAEWEYAYGAGVTDPSDLYVKICLEPGEWYNVPPRFAEIMVWWETDVEPRLKDAGLDAQIPNLQLKLKGAEVGTKRPNAWGLYDMLGNLGECLLDRFDLGKLKRKDGSPVRGGTGPLDWHNQDTFCFKAEETDPLNWPTDGDVVQMVRGGHCWNRWRGHFFYKVPPGIMGNRLPFRLCIGPDLMKEKGLKK